MDHRHLLAALVAAAALAFGAAPAGAWAPAETAPIHPGVNTTTDGSSCTSNFVFTNGADVLIGMAAHCAGTGAATETDGCDAGTLPEGTPVEVDGATRPGTLVYSSWARMQARNETNANACAYNDFALIRLDPADVERVNPSVPFWGGPTGSTATVAAGAKVLSYGNSVLRQGIELLSPKEGIQLSQGAGGWNHTVYTATPGIPGDSGSGFMDKQGRAFGVLSTVALAPLALSNGVSNLALALDYARSFADFGGVQLVNGTEPFRGPILPLP